MLQTTSQTLLQHLSLLFVPAGVGIIVHLLRVADEWLPLLLSLLSAPSSRWRDCTGDEALRPSWRSRSGTAERTHHDAAHQRNLGLSLDLAAARPDLTLLAYQGAFWIYKRAGHARWPTRC
jgi:hypothetical protein